MNCVPVESPIVILQNGTFDKSYSWGIGNPPVIVDITGFTGVMTIREKLKDTTPILVLNTITQAWSADGPTGLYFTNEEWRIYINNTDSRIFCPSKRDIVGVYDLFLINPSGEAVFKQYGPASMIASVTEILE